MKNKIGSEFGSYTIEASISLVIFVSAIMLILSQVRVLIGECIMQNAVNNMAKETASYVYVFDRLGLVFKENETETLDNIYSEGKVLSEEYTGLLESIFPDESSGGASIDVEGIKGNAESMIDSIKNIMSILDSANSEDLKKELEALGRSGVDDLLKLASNKILEHFYKWKLNAYLPMEYDKFCNYFMIKDNAVSFKCSRVFPDQNNNSILVVVEYDTKSLVNFLPLDRHIVKYAYTAAWVESNAN